MILSLTKTAVVGFGSAGSSQGKSAFLCRSEFFPINTRLQCRARKLNPATGLWLGGSTQNIEILVLEVINRVVLQSLEVWEVEVVFLLHFCYSLITAYFARNVLFKNVSLSRLPGLQIHPPGDESKELQAVSTKGVFVAQSSSWLQCSFRPTAVGDVYLWLSFTLPNGEQATMQGSSNKLLIVSFLHKHWNKTPKSIVQWHKLSLVRLTAKEYRYQIAGVVRNQIKNFNSKLN